MKNYTYGLRAEDRLAGAYSRRGHSTSYYERSRGAADLFVTRGARRLYIQVRSVRRSTSRIEDSDSAFEFMSKRLSDAELSRLVRHAKDARGQPAVSLTNGDYFWTWRLHVARGGFEFTLAEDGWLPRRPLAR